MVNGTVVTADRTIRADVRIENGRIATIGENLSREQAHEILNAKGSYVMPGGVDVHTHLDLSVGEEKVSDGFFYGSVAAAHGGTTTIVEHPGFGPKGCQLSHQVNLYRNQAENEMAVDYGFHGVVQHVDDKVLDAIKALSENGTPSFKVYLTYSARLGDEDIIAVLKATHAAGGLTTFHAENHAIISSLTEDFHTNSDISNPAIHPKSRPDYSEAEAIGRLIALSRAAGNAPLYIVHLSTASGLEVIRAARKQGLPVYVETCPQYLILTDSCYQKPNHKGLQYIMSPPLRKQTDCDALWDGLADGSIDVVATDHCSFAFSKKLEKGKENIFNSPGGIPGIETRVPLLFSEGVLKKRIGLNRFVELIAENPARIMGMYPMKGVLETGADADLMILDPVREKIVTIENMHQHVDYTPFNGMTVTGWPTTVMLRGELLVRDGKFMGRKGSGQYIVRKTINTNNLRGKQ